jgi:hypothetical protein
VDAAYFKTYVFQLLFFKRISDVYDEGYAAAERLMALLKREGLPS